MKNPGKLVELYDGRKGIIYNRQQLHPEKITVHLIGDDYLPVISEKTGQHAMVFVTADKIKRIIGFVD